MEGVERLVLKISLPDLLDFIHHSPVQLRDLELVLSERLKDVLDVSLLLLRTHLTELVGCIAMQIIHEL